MATLPSDFKKPRGPVQESYPSAACVRAHLSQTEAPPPPCQAGSADRNSQAGNYRHRPAAHAKRASVRPTWARRRPPHPVGREAQGGRCACVKGTFSDGFFYARLPLLLLLPPVHALTPNFSVSLSWRSGVCDFDCKTSQCRPSQREAVRP